MVNSIERLWMALRLASLSAVCCLLSAVCSGCAHLPLNARYAGPAPLPAQIASYYAFSQAAGETHTEILETRPRFHCTLIQLPLSVPPVSIAPSFEPTEPIIEIEWFESQQPGRRPAILFSPILGGDYPLERGLCRFFASHGLHVALVHRKTLKVSPEKDVAYLERLLRQAILRNRQVVDWMARHDRVDPARLGSFGISMGGIANVITAAVEPRLRAHVIALAGGSLADILRDSPDRLLAKPRARYLAHHQMDAATLHRLLNERLTTDPLRLAPYVDARRVLMVIALADRTIGTDKALRLWNALGRPEVAFLPLGHYTAYLALPYLKYISLRFFRWQLDLS